MAEKNSADIDENLNSAHFEEERREFKQKALRPIGRRACAEKSNRGDWI